MFSMHKLLKLIASRHIWRQLKDSFWEKKCFSIEWQFKLPIGERYLSGSEVFRFEFKKKYDLQTPILAVINWILDSDWHCERGLWSVLCPLDPVFTHRKSHARPISFIAWGMWILKYSYHLTNNSYEI